MTTPRPDQAAFEIFAKLHPHEAHRRWPYRFWRHFQAQCPGVTRAAMRKMLKETEEKEMP